MNLDYRKEVLQDGCTYIPNLCSSWWINAFTVSLTVIDIECIVSLWYPKKSFFLKMSSICHAQIGKISHIGSLYDMSLFKLIPNIPSGKQTVCYWKWWFIDLSIKNGDLPSLFVNVYQRVIKKKTHDWLSRWFSRTCHHAAWSVDVSILERLTSFCCWKKNLILVKSTLSALME
jgi:hypothetical protein